MIKQRSKSTMNTKLPKPLQQAKQNNIDFFLKDGYEWKFEIEENVEHVEEFVGESILIFANNGFGDYLFLKANKDNGSYDTTAFEYFHETPEINEIGEDIEILLGLKQAPPSKDNYPQAIYQTGEIIEIGDHVQYKVWVEFWKGWQDGTVIYVPGISKKNPKYEYNGLKWIAIKGNNMEIGVLVHPDTGIVNKIKFVERATTYGAY